MAYVSSPSSPLAVEDIPEYTSPSIVTSNKRVSDYEFPATAIKVNSPYQSYLKHSFTQHACRANSNPMTPQLQKIDSYVNKYNAHTNSSKSLHFITIPTVSIIPHKKSGAPYYESNMDSPISPLVSPPPPYLHSDHGGNGIYSHDVKRWPGEATVNVPHPLPAKILTPQEAGPTVVEYPTSPENPPLTARAVHLPETNETTTLYDLQIPGSVHHNAPLTRNVSACAPLSPYPTYWEDVCQSKAHRIFLPVGMVLLGSAILVLIMQIFMEWLVVLPALGFLMFGIHFGRYCWKRHRFLKRQEENKALASVPTQVGPNKVVSSLCNKHLETDTCSGPYRPSHDYPTNHINVAWRDRPQRHVRFQEPKIVSSVKLDQQPCKQVDAPQANTRAYQQQPTYSLTVSPDSRQLVSNASPYYQNPRFLSPMDSPQTPPPAYFLRNISLSLPEIDSIGDLVSEFEVDLTTIEY
ncbi:hypothetical protein BC939DRAFT_451632 [Gamsiella multidivaricata]|uniref:uncharacterized protein n=1 Tax=Gamsiella multidivaricata TaxID=101098 RepID=UPI00222091C7|nr:uncharacterized protein BC939DRAFT_451632 [Gamsiella multidivaricata]KAG0357993.1 hypothetical protein BGZ54_000095 [Gamsiella multidivaricata]KAI7823297.1 hypothetical protein BC939DRAFT_451632 [Gamsiella multidivaricata]